MIKKKNFRFFELSRQLLTKCKFFIFFLTLNMLNCIVHKRYFRREIHVDKLLSDQESNPALTDYQSGTVDTNQSDM